MSHKEDWLTKQFDFKFPVTEYVKFLNVLRTTPEHLKVLVAGLSPSILTKRIDNSWSIQENTGHFLTVESLFLGRLEDFQQNVRVLRAARFEENQTDEANYNEKDIVWILDAFCETRSFYIAQLDALPPDEFGKVALHPRLNTPMRICDMLQFHAAHDQHHLTRIKEIMLELL